MPSTVTLYSVKIACPGEAAMELVVARDVIAQWNAHHALAEHRLLLPLGEDFAGDAGHDLLLEFFCGAAGCPDDLSEDDAEQQIDEQLRDGKPALVYFSQARADLNRAHLPQHEYLEQFKKRHPAATVDSYVDEKEFRAKFSQRLEAAMRGHVHFQASSRDSRQAVTAEVVPAPPKIEAPLSDKARQILFEACDDFEAYIGHTHVGGILRIQANGRQLVEQQDTATVAAWDGAFRELLSGGYIRDAGFNGQLFQISPKGFDFLKTLGKTPVGYIAELGGM